MSKFVVQASWDDVPHLSKAVREELWASIPPFQRKARSQGIPELGKGAIYPIPQADVTVPDFQLPSHWKRVFGLDVGWNNTAVVWGAINPESDTVYLYQCFKRGQAEPAVHASAIKMVGGDWVPGVCDPAGLSSSQIDGVKLLKLYKSLGLNVEKAVNAVEAGIMTVYERLSTGRLKVFASLAEWFAEYSLYRRKEGGVVHKENDHLMDATRYLVMSGLQRAIAPPKTQPKTLEEYEYTMPFSGDQASLGWMQ